MEEDVLILRKCQLAFEKGKRGSQYDKSRNYWGNRICRGRISKAFAGTQGDRNGTVLEAILTKNTQKYMEICFSWWRTPVWMII